MSARLSVYTDGSSTPGPTGSKLPGGWAWCSEDGRYASGYDPETTISRMELTAAIEAIESNDGPLEIFSDSAYVVNGMNQQWYIKWNKNGWRNAKGKPVANADLWRELIDATVFENVVFTHVKGHSGVPGNERADELCGRARINKTGEKS